MIENGLWLGALVVAAFWTALVANSSPAVLYVIRAWSGGVLMGALVGTFAGSAVASVSPEWQWPVGIVVGAVVCVLVATYRGKSGQLGIN